MTQACLNVKKDLVGLFVAIIALTVLLVLPHVAGSMSPWSPLSATGVLLALALFVVTVGRSQGQLYRSERRFQRLLEAAPDAVIITDQGGAIVFVNWQTERLFGHGRDDMVGQTLEALLWRPEANRADRADLSLTSTETVAAPEFVGRRKDGSEFAAEMSFSQPDTDEGTLVVYVVRDVSEAMKTEQRRAARHAVQRALAKATDTPVATARVVQTVCEGLGWDVAVLWLVDAAGEGLRNAGHWHTGSEESLDLRLLLREATLPPGFGLPGRVCRDGEPVRVDGPRLQGDCPRLVEASREGFRTALGVPVAYDDKVFGMLELYHRDARACDDHLVETMSRIGALLGQFLDRRKTFERVSQSEAIKAAILGAALDPIITLDHEGVVIACNPATETVFAGSRARVLGAKLADLIATPAGAGQFLSADEGGLLGKRVETTARRADSSVFPVEVVVARIVKEGKPMFTAYIRDLTERKQSEEALRRSEEKFLQAQKMEALGRLSGGVAHDFNNLLTVLSVSCELLLADDRLHEGLRDLIKEVMKVGGHGAALTRQLLAFSRKQTMEARLLDLNSVITEMRKLLSRVIGDNVKVLTRLAPALLPVKADQGQLEQVLMNLAVNARDAMPQGGTLLIETCHLEADTPPDAQVPPGTYAVLTVRDTGVGMDEAVLARIFEPFFTTKEQGKGTGLGLATVYGIVKQSGGHITVQSEVGRGTTFKVYLPSAQEPASAQEEAADRGEADAVTPGHPHERVEPSEDAEEVLCPRDERPSPMDLALTDLARPARNGQGRSRLTSGRR